MVTVSDQMDNIVLKTQRLIDLCRNLQAENSVLKSENKEQKNALDLALQQQKEADEKIRLLKLAKSIEGTSEKTLDIKQKINEFVREIDKCVTLLKK